jgi:3-methyladenine DNA glycosylase/8-oxoguanine DNA glycosylase
MPAHFTIPVPDDYSLARDACSYGYFLLAPNHWDPLAQTLTRVLDLEGGPATITISQPRGEGKRGPMQISKASHFVRGVDLACVSDRRLAKREITEASALIARMLRLDEDHATIKRYHKVDPRFKGLGRGRLFRSPTLFEDVIKTVTSCNVQWPSTVVMNERLCAVVGEGGGFPSARKLARARASTLRARCRVGYRDKRIIELAQMFASGEIDPHWCEDPATGDEELRQFLIGLPGIGPYAAANIMQLLGRYHLLPLDTESVRHGKTILGMEGTDKEIMKRIDGHFAPFGEHKFRSYWFELWEFYEAKRGPSWTWDRETTGKTFTASQL